MCPQKSEVWYVHEPTPHEECDYYVFYKNVVIKKKTKNWTQKKVF